MVAGTESGTKSTATHGATASNTGSIAIGDEATTGGATASAAGAIAIGTKGTVATTASGADAVAIGTGAEATGTSSIAIGKNADAKTQSQGIAVGESTLATGFSSVSIGYQSQATGSGSVSIGGVAFNSQQNSVAIGYGTGAEFAYANAIGSYSTVSRYGETTISGDHASANKNPWGLVQWKGQTTNATETELFLHGVSSNRCTVIASSAIHFMIRVVIREPATGDCKIVEIKGGIKRNGSNTTALIGSVTSTTICEDAGASGWSVAVTADDTNEALKIAVTGEASHTINWHAVGQLIEVRD
jgi:hypothetical protein